MTTSRNTLQRDIVLQTVLAMHEHATADMVYARIHAVHPSISRATVYRNLRMLEGEGKLMHIEVPDGADYYEAKTREHYHIRCASCGKLFDAALPVIPELIELEQSADRDFDICACNLLFVGVCPECKARQGRPENLPTQGEEKSKEE